MANYCDQCGIALPRFDPHWLCPGCRPCSKSKPCTVCRGWSDTEWRALSKWLVGFRRGPPFESRKHSRSRSPNHSNVSYVTADKVKPRSKSLGHEGSSGRLPSATQTAAEAADQGNFYMFPVPPPPSPSRKLDTEVTGTRLLGDPSTSAGDRSSADLGRRGHSRSYSQTADDDVELIPRTRSASKAAVSGSHQSGHGSSSPEDLVESSAGRRGTNMGKSRQAGVDQDLLRSMMGTVETLTSHLVHLASARGLASSTVPNPLPRGTLGDFPPVLTPQLKQPVFPVFALPSVSTRDHSVPAPGMSGIAADFNSHSRSGPDSGVRQAKDTGDGTTASDVTGITAVHADRSGRSHPPAQLDKRSGEVDSPSRSSLRSGDRTEEEETDRHFDLTFKGAISALYALLPSLPTPVGDDRQRVRPMSALPGDSAKEDSSLFRHFPQSTLIADCVAQVHECWWDTPPHKADLSVPKSLPPNSSSSRTVDSKVPALTGYKDVYYRDPQAAFTLDPPMLGPNWERSVAKPPSVVSMDYAKFTALEKMMRRVVATISSVDILVAGLRKHTLDMVSMDAEQRAAGAAVSDKLTGCLTLAISHAAALSVRATASCVMARRRSALLCPSKLVLSDTLKEWLMCQPLNQPKHASGLFGPVVLTLMKEVTPDLSEFRKGISFLARPPARGDQQQRGGRKRSFNQAFAPAQDSSPSPDQGRGRGRGKRSRGRFRRQFRGGKKGFPFPPPSAPAVKSEGGQRS